MHVIALCSLHCSGCISILPPNEYYYIPNPYVQSCLMVHKTGDIVLHCVLFNFSLIFWKGLQCP